jgi:CheY-like chemotaxis protein
MLPLKGRLLIVDDVAMTCRLVELNVRRHFPRGWDVDTATTPQAAVEAALHTAFTVIVMDEIFSPRSMRGSDAIRAIRQREAASGAARALIITSTADAELVERAAEGVFPSGADAVWAKPIPSAIDGTLQSRLAALLQRASAADGPALPNGSAHALTAASHQSYLASSGVGPALRRAVAAALLERPADPIATIGRLMIEESLRATAAGADESPA